MAFSNAKGLRNTPSATEPLRLETFVTTLVLATMLLSAATVMAAAECLRDRRRRGNIEVG